ncbi:MAG: zinc metallopeptidase, partial [Bacteroidia bacterium]|nr:zinc metallopeptidase [Bacteroidia bacterium]
WVMMRSAMVPIVNISGNIMGVLTFIIALVAYSMPVLTNTMLLVFIVLQSIITLFTLVTLPVEIDASRRALNWLNNSGITGNYEHRDAKDALTWAAYTYIVQALSSVATLLYYIWRFTSGGRRGD